MTDISLVDVTIHVDKKTNDRERIVLETNLRSVDGVVSVHMPGDKPHLVTIEYNPDVTTSSDLLDVVEKVAGHSEMIGL